MSTRRFAAERIEDDVGDYTPTIYLSPINHYFYWVLHGQLESPELNALRARTLRNAVEGIKQREPLLLPSHFAIHLAVVSSDEKVLLRQRKDTAHFFPGAWEVGIGEFMHGPNSPSIIQHFAGGNPSLDMFLQGAVHEELAYPEAKPEDFHIFGFAVERISLAPKLICLYISDQPIKKLMEGAVRKALDPAKDVSSVACSEHGVLEVLKSRSRFDQWGPTSRLALILALLRRTSTLKERQSLLQSMSKRMQTWARKKRLYQRAGTAGATANRS